MPARSVLYTLGYEGQTIETLIARLQRAGVATVVDVRQLPLSHKKGFSKRALAQAVEAAGLGYRHLPALGCPKAMRDDYHASGDWAAFSHRFAEHLAGQAAAVADLAATARSTAVCLLCFEADAGRCHRSLVAAAAAQAGGLRVIHLTASGDD